MPVSSSCSSARARVKPLKSTFAATFDNSADELLDDLSKRAYSSQWEIPQDINNKIVSGLKRQFSGKTFPAELRVLIWQINDLKDYSTHACNEPRLHDDGQDSNIRNDNRL